MKIIVTGGAGFIGSALVRYAVKKGYFVVNVDSLKYSGRLENLESVEKNENYMFERADICNPTDLRRVIIKYEPDAIMHLAAESHVDRSIDGPEAFIKTNVNGTFNLLEAAREYWLIKGKPMEFRFQHVSTDEVYGSLGQTGQFTEGTPYAPRSPYSASKAASDHLVRAWGETYKLPVLITNCSNNYGPYQFPEKLIPTTIINALSGLPLPIYGNGENIRDWLFVEDHVRALFSVLKAGKVGRTYNIGGDTELTNIQVVSTICNILDEVLPSDKPYSSLISFVGDRPGHDLRYAIDSARIKSELGWAPVTPFYDGLKYTVDWYIKNKKWWKLIQQSHSSTKRLGTTE